jgi:hypothetical protein
MVLALEIKVIPLVLSVNFIAPVARTSSQKRWLRTNGNPAHLKGSSLLEICFSARQILANKSDVLRKVQFLNPLRRPAMSEIEPKPLVLAA